MAVDLGRYFTFVLNFHDTNPVYNGVDAETVPVNTSFIIIIKDAIC